MLNLKEISYRLFSINYQLGKRLPIKKGSVFAIMTHDASESGNIGALVNYMKNKADYSFIFYTGKNRKHIQSRKWMSFFDLIVRKAFYMARAEFILMDNAFLPMAFFKVREGSRVIQLWHGTGSVKKFGQDSNTGRIRFLEKRMNRNIDFLTVNGRSQVEQYSGAFGIPETKVIVTGLPRTDWLIQFLNNGERNRFEKIRKKIEKFFSFHLTGKKVILYAPTFRDEEISSPKIHLELQTLLKSLSSDIVIFLRLHPYVAQAYKGDEMEGTLNVSTYPDLNELMVISDALITDYSSLIFDYAIFNRPMFFYADDISSFREKGRGFYLNYEEELPGKIAENEEDLAYSLMEALNKKEAPLFEAKRGAFVQKYFDYMDGKSAERVFLNCIKK